MNDPAVQPESPPSLDLSVDSRPPPAPTKDTPPPLSETARPDLIELEHRVQRLEETVTALKDTQALEERVVERVTERLQKTVTALSDKITAAPPALAGAARRTAAEETPSRHPRGRYMWLFVDMLW